MEVGYGLVISDMVWYCTSGDTSGDTTGVATPVVLLGHSLLLMYQYWDWSRGASRTASRATYVIPLNLVCYFSFHFSVVSLKGCSYKGMQG